MDGWMVGRVDGGKERKKKGGRSSEGKIIRRGRPRFTDLPATVSVQMWSHRHQNLDLVLPQASVTFSSSQERDVKQGRGREEDLKILEVHRDQLFHSCSPGQTSAV